MSCLCPTLRAWSGKEARHESRVSQLLHAHRIRVTSLPLRKIRECSESVFIVTMALRCISLWSFHRSPQRRRKIDIFRYISRFLRILSKSNQKKKNVLERYIGLEPWDLFLLKIKCYRKCLQNYKGTIFGVAWTEKNRFEIINDVTDEPKVTIFSVISLMISTDQRYWTERSPFSSWWAGHLSRKLKDLWLPLV